MVKATSLPVIRKELRTQLGYIASAVAARAEELVSGGCVPVLAHGYRTELLEAGSDKLKVAGQIVDIGDAGCAVVATASGKAWKVYKTARGEPQLVFGLLMYCLEGEGGCEIRSEEIGPPSAAAGPVEIRAQLVVEAHDPFVTVKLHVWGAVEPSSGPDLKATIKVVEVGLPWKSAARNQSLALGSATWRCRTRDTADQIEAPLRPALEP